MTSANVDLEAVINDLADKVKKLTVENSMLRTALNSELAAKAASQKEQSGADS